MTEVFVATPSEYEVSRTLGVRTELRRQLTRRRTWISAIIAVALPLIVVAAVKFGPSSSGGDGGGFGDGDFDLVGLATSGAWNFALTMVFFASGFLLTILAAMFLGDSVASEASWSTLRYLLAAPVPRRRLLRAKAIVGVLLIIGVTLILVIAAFLIGWLSFGNAPLASPLGGAFTQAESAQRMAIISAYVVASLLFPAGVAFLMSTITDVPLAAVGAAVVIVIISGILDALDALGDLRRFLPTDYGSAWTGALEPQIAWTDMAIGASYSLALFAILVTVAVIRFDRKDITS